MYPVTNITGKNNNLQMATEPKTNFQAFASLHVFPHLFGTLLRDHGEPPVNSRVK